MDCGIKVKDQEMGGMSGYPTFPKHLKIDATVVCHAHLDHSGFIPALADRTLFYGAPPTQGLAELLVNDAKKVDPNLPFSSPNIEHAFRNFVLTPYGVEHKLDSNVRFTLHDAGHLPGSATVDLRADGKLVRYTSDFKIDEMRLQPKMQPPTDECDVLVIECTYGLKEHPNRQETEKRLIKRVHEIIESGGNVLMPAFAVGRTQELAMILFAYDVELPVYVDGMGNKASHILLNYPKYVKNHTILKEALRNIKTPGKDKSVPLRHPSVIISTAGMLEGGPAMSYLLAMDKRFRDERKPGAVFFSGFCLPTTNGWFLQNKQFVYLKKKGVRTGKPINIAMPNELFHLSAHAGRSDILDYIKRSNPEKVICVHGDNCPAFADGLRQQGWDAAAPENGERFEF
jgi:putative mRNA 3-end processing factor